MCNRGTRAAKASGLSPKGHYSNTHRCRFGCGSIYEQLLVNLHSSMAKQGQHLLS